MRKYPESDLKVKFKNASAVVVSCTRRDKKEYHDQMLTKCGQDNKKYWEIVNSMIGKKKENLGGLRVEETFYARTGDENKLTNKLKVLLCHRTLTNEVSNDGPHSTVQKHPEYFCSSVDNNLAD